VSATPALALIILGAGAAAGGLGALLGIGGGVFLVPFLNLVLHLPITTAAAISLTTVIAASSTVSASRAGEQLINLRLGMTLEAATAAGGLLGGLTSYLLTPATLQKIFGVVAIVIAVLMVARINRRNVLPADADAGFFGGEYHDADSGRTVVYRVRRLPLALAASFVAGNVSSLLGIGGGVIKVPVLNAWCGVPLRAAAATSAFMIGVTATAGTVIYYGRGEIVPSLAAAAVIGVQIGSRVAMALGERLSSRGLKLLMASVLAIVAIVMFFR
jgi:uncharacterized membrane protein YfcA